MIEPCAEITNLIFIIIMIEKYFLEVPLYFEKQVILFLKAKF